MYLEKELRKELNPEIMNFLEIIATGTESDYVKGEYFGSLVSKLCWVYLSTPKFAERYFNYRMFDDTRKKEINRICNNILSKIKNADALHVCKVYGYVISAIYWGMLGKHPKIKPADTGLRAYYTGILNIVKQSLSYIDYRNALGNRDAIITLRRHMVLSGMIDSILLETFRRFDSLHNNKQYSQHGDIWKDGQLLE